MTLVLLCAALLRFHDLGNIPTGLEHDEVATWHMVVSVLEGHHPLYFEQGYGHEPLYNYFTALPVALLGSNWLGERFWAPWFGLFAVAAAYALFRRLFSPLIAIAAAGLQATVLWALFFNRLGLRLNLLPLLLLVAAYCFWRGLATPSRRRQLIWLSAAGAMIGLCFYTYMSSIVVLPLFALFSIYLVARDRWIEHTPWRRLLARRWPLIVCLTVALLIMAPLLHYRLHRPAHTATPQRESQVDTPLRELRKGNLRPVLQNGWAILKMWNVTGELYWQLNYGSRPVFVEPISGLLFWLGLLIALRRWRDPPMAFVLLWTGLGLLPSLITSEAPSWPRTMLASPAALALPAIAVEQLSAWLRRTPHAAGWTRLPHALLALSLILTAILTGRDFLVRWPKHPRVRYAFQSSMTEALRYLEAQSDATPVVMAGLSPHDMDPWSERATLQRRDLAIRWVDTRSAIVLPAEDAARLVTLDITPIDPALAEWLGLARAPIVAQGELAPRGGSESDPDAPIYTDPAYTVYQIDAATLKSRLPAGSAFAGADAFKVMRLTQPPQFGGLVQFIGCTWLTEPRPGALAQALTFWTALKTGPRSTVYGEPSLKIFMHLLDATQHMAAGVDTLGAAPDTWRAGDTIVQLHTFWYPAEAGVYAVELGWYAPPDGPRLPVDNAGAPGQRILLDPLKVSP